MEIAGCEIILQFQLFPGPIIIVVFGYHVTFRRQFCAGIGVTGYLINEKVIVSEMKVKMLRETFIFKTGICGMPDWLQFPGKVCLTVRTRDILMCTSAY